MTIQLELDPEFVERLSAEAKARGIGWEEYAESLLREAIATRSDSQGTLTVAELNTMLKTIAVVRIGYRSCRRRRSLERASMRNVPKWTVHVGLSTAIFFCDGCNRTIPITQWLPRRWRLWRNKEPSSAIPLRTWPSSGVHALGQWIG